MTIVTGVSTAEEFLDAINDKGASLTNNATPLSLLGAINATGGSVTFESTNEDVIEAVNTQVATLEPWTADATGYNTLLVPDSITHDFEDSETGSISMWNNEDFIVSFSLEDNSADEHKMIKVISDPSIEIYYLYSESGVYSINKDDSYIKINGSKVYFKDENIPKYQDLYVVTLSNNITSTDTKEAAGIDEVLTDFFYIDTANE